MSPDYVDFAERQERLDYEASEFDLMRAMTIHDWGWPGWGWETALGQSMMSPDPCPKPPMDGGF
jgi:hypothetical protein